MVPVGVSEQEDPSQILGINHRPEGVQIFSLCPIARIIAWMGRTLLNRQCLRRETFQSFLP